MIARPLAVEQADERTARIIELIIDEMMDAVKYCIENDKSLTHTILYCKLAIGKYKSVLNHYPMYTMDVWFGNLVDAALDPDDYAVYDAVAGMIISEIN